jgi:hypothetical protein
VDSGDREICRMRIPQLFFFILIIQMFLEWVWGGSAQSPVRGDVSYRKPKKKIFFFSFTEEDSSEINDWKVLTGGKTAP